MKQRKPNRISCTAATVVLLSTTCFSAQADDQTGNSVPIVGVVACDSFAEIREQCAWLGGLIGFPVLGGLPDTYAMMVTGGKGLQGLDINRPIGAIVAVQGDAPVIHGFLPATDPQTLIDTFTDIPFRSMVEMTAAGEWVVVTPLGQPATINQPLDMLTSITSHLSIGVKLFPSRLPDSMKESLLDGVEQVEPAGQQIFEELPFTGVDKEMVSEALAQTEAVLFGLAIEKKTDQIFIESRTIFTDGGLPGAFWATAGDVTPSLRVPLQEGDEAIRVQIAQKLNDVTQLEDIEGFPAVLGQMKLTELQNLMKEIVAPQILEFGAFEFVASVAIPEDQAEGEPVPSIVFGIGIADGNAMAEKLKGFVNGVDGNLGNLSFEFDVAEDNGFSFHDIVMAPLGKVTLAIGEKSMYAMTRAVDSSEYEAVASEQTDQFQPIAAVDVRLEPLLDGVAGLPPQMAMVVEKLEPQGELNLLVRPITRGVAVRLTADSEAVEFGGTLGSGIFTLMPPAPAVINE